MSHTILHTTQQLIFIVSMRSTQTGCEHCYFLFSGRFDTCKVVWNTKKNKNKWWIVERDQLQSFHKICMRGKFGLNPCRWHGYYMCVTSPYVRMTPRLEKLYHTEKNVRGKLILSSAVHSNGKTKVRRLNRQSIYKSASFHITTILFSSTLSRTLCVCYFYSNMEHGTNINTNVIGSHVCSLIASIQPSTIHILSTMTFRFNFETVKNH